MRAHKTSFPIATIIVVFIITWLVHIFLMKKRILYSVVLALCHFDILIFLTTTPAAGDYAFHAFIGFYDRLSTSI